MVKRAAVGLDQLPYEIVQALCARMGTKELQAFAQTASRFCECAQPVLFRSVTLEASGPVADAWPEVVYTSSRSILSHTRKAKLMLQPFANHDWAPRTHQADKHPWLALFRMLHNLVELEIVVDLQDLYVYDTIAEERWQYYAAVLLELHKQRPDSPQSSFVFKRYDYTPWSAYAWTALCQPSKTFRTDQGISLTIQNQSAYVESSDDYLISRLPLSMFTSVGLLDFSAKDVLRVNPNAALTRLALSQGNLADILAVMTRFAESLTHFSFPWPTTLHPAPPSASVHLPRLEQLEVYQSSQFVTVDEISRIVRTPTTCAWHIT